MAAFEYDALDNSGATRHGVLEADSERQARRLLRDQRLVPLAVRPGRAAAGDRNRLPGWRGAALKGEQLALFTRLLGTLLGAGLPLDDALRVVARQSDNHAAERTVLGVRARIVEGNSLESALGDYPRTFPEIYRATVGAGERSRHLPLVLEELARYVEEHDRLRQRVRIALLYPAVLTVTAVLVVAGLLTFVVPEVTRVFADAGQALPGSTRVLVALSDAVRAWGVVVLLIAAAVMVIVLRLLRAPGPRSSAQRLLMTTPIIGRLLVMGDCGRFARTLSILLDSGVNMLDALNIASKSVALLPLRTGLETALGRVREGAALGQALADVPYVPGLVSHLVTSGENAGELPRMLATAAEALEHKTNNATAVLLGVFEPVLIFVMGGIVLFIVIAILLPIFEMNQLV